MKVILYFSPMKILLTIFLVFFSVTLLGIVTKVYAEKKCVTSPFKGTNVQQCGDTARRFIGSGRLECETTAGMLEVARAEIECDQAVLEKEFSRRESKIGKSDSEQLNRELSLKEQFEKANLAYCREVTACTGGTIDSLNAWGCQVSLLSYLIKQFVRLNSGYLTFDKFEKKNYKNIKVVEKYFSSFAQSYCSLPASVWKKDQIPPACKSTVIDEVASFASPDCPPPWDPTASK